MPQIVQIQQTQSTLESNLALDEALLLSAEAGESGEVLRFWEWPTPAVVLGAGGSIAIDVCDDVCEADRVPILRRASGGGTVLLGRGCLLFSLVLAYERAVELRLVNASYRWILERICSALRPVANAQAAGISDLAVEGRKFSGNAQQRKTRHVLHHGTILYDFDLPLIGRYLKTPEREPSYREARGHSSFVMNLPSDSNTLMNLLTEAFEAERGEVLETVWQRVPGLISERYSQREWNHRR